MYKFKEMRELQGYTQANIAFKLGVAKNTISQWETNKRQPDLDTVIKLANLYNCTVDSLIGHKEVEVNSNALIVPEEKKQAVKILLALPENYFNKIYGNLEVYSEMLNLSI